MAEVYPVQIVIVLLNYFDQCIHFYLFGWVSMCVGVYYMWVWLFLSVPFICSYILSLMLLFFFFLLYFFKDYFLYYM